MIEKTEVYRNVLAQLKSILLKYQGTDDFKLIIEDRDAVFARYQPVFTPDGVENITQEEFRDFLMFRNNRHWSGLQRMGPDITRDMQLLKKVLLELLDESHPISKRLDQLFPGGYARVKRLGKAVLTPILLIAYPERYGVWNGTSEGAMRELGIWPNFERGVYM